MSQDDPFATLHPERSVVVPTPGRSAPRAAPTAPSPASADRAALAGLGKTSGLNPLVAAASPLLNAVPQLRVSSLPDPAALRAALIEGVRDFETNARAANLRPEHVIAARYVLCTFLDEAATGTPWGGSGAWARQSLLVTFHNETWGGEKFFQLLAKLAENPQANRDLLELMQVCLALGFRGRYQAAPNGQSQLDALHERLYLLLRQQRGESEKELSPHWRGVASRRLTVLSALPLWVAAAVAGLLLIVIYLGFSWSLNRRSDPVFSAIRAIRAPITTVAAPAPASTSAPVAPPQAPPAPRLAGFLAPEIEQNLVAVQDLADRSVITIKGDGFFKPGSNRVEDEFQPLLRRIAEALNSVPGKVLITGHTDNVPIRSMVFPSNWHLSQARADRVKTILASTLTAPDRLNAEGRADAEPVATNDTPANQARNRRVEIALFVAGEAGRTQ
jgi:type VI secretion system protein ImpK